MSQKYHVTIEDCIDEDEVKQQRLGSSGFVVLDIDLAQKQSWDEMGVLEEQARYEKLQNQSTAKANASETARIINEAQQSSGY